MGTLKHLGSITSLNTLCGEDWMDGGLVDLSMVSSVSDSIKRSTCIECQFIYAKRFETWYEVTFENGATNTLQAESKEAAVAMAVKNLMEVTGHSEETLVRPVSVERAKR